MPPDNIDRGKIPEWEKKLGYDLKNYTGIEKRTLLRNCTSPELGLHVLKCTTEVSGQLEMSLLQDDDLKKIAPNNN